MTKQEKRASWRSYNQIYGNCFYVIKYETKYSSGRVVIRYDYYMFNEKFRKRVDRFTSRKDIIKIEKRLVKADRYQDDII